MNYNYIKKTFDNYVKNYDIKNDKIKLKYNHSYKVAEISEILAKKLDLSDSDVLLAKVIGLLHDIGRFEQVKKYNTFKDINFDHVSYGVKVLFNDNLIRNFIDTNEFDNIIYNSIKNHNKYSIPENLDERTKMFCKIIKDADKIDIFRILAKEYKLTFDDTINDFILEEYFKGRVIKNSDVTNLSEQIILDCAFIFDINYKESFKILKQTNNLILFLNSIDCSDKNKKVLEKIKDKIFKIMEEKLC